ncbi:MAG: TetR/AcrR family transcriptional regulator [Anaerolineae bacterium]|nr:TetR/AcrR family transcriptional regulator [Anaerolineae bacterium]
MSRPPTRHVRRKAATHQRLIDAARDLISAHGYGQVDILTLTERADVSKATFYKHFANKEACVRELMEQGFDALVAEIVSAPRAHPFDPAWVRGSFERAFRWAQENRELMLIMVGGAASTQLNAFGRQYLATVIERTLINEFPQQTLTALIPAPVVAQIVTGMMIQLLGWWLENDTGHTATDLAEFMLIALQRGITAQQGADASISEASA